MTMNKEPGSGTGEPEKSAERRLRDERVRRGLVPPAPSPHGDPQRSAKLVREWWEKHPSPACWDPARPVARRPAETEPVDQLLEEDPFALPLDGEVAALRVWLVAARVAVESDPGGYGHMAPGGAFRVCAAGHPPER